MIRKEYVGKGVLKAVKNVNYSYGPGIDRP